METNGIDLRKCRGFGFKAKIEGTPCEGKIQVEDGDVYLCQNMKNGAECRDRLGYKFSWYIGNCSEIDLMRKWVVNLAILPRDPETYKDWQVGDNVMMKYIGRNEQVEVIFRSGELVVCKDSDKNATETKTCEQLYREGGRLVLTDIEKQILEGKKSEWKPHEFRQGEPVLVRDVDNGIWHITTFVERKSGRGRPFYANDGMGRTGYYFCLPYNEKTMHLLGTKEDYKEE